MISATVGSWPRSPGCSRAHPGAMGAFQVGAHACHVPGAQALDPHILQAVEDEARDLALGREAAVHPLVMVADAQGGPVRLAPEPAQLARDQIRPGHAEAHRIRPDLRPLAPILAAAEGHVQGRPFGDRPDRGAQRPLQLVQVLPGRVRHVRRRLGWRSTPAAPCRSSADNIRPRCGARPRRTC